jgi:hypothetical protein
VYVIRARDFRLHNAILLPTTYFGSTTIYRRKYIRWKLSRLATGLLLILTAFLLQTFGYYNILAINEMTHCLLCLQTQNDSLHISLHYNCNWLVLQVRTDGSVLCYCSVGTGLSTRQPATRTRTVQKASTNSITRDEDGFLPPWPTSWTCSRIINGLSKSTITFPCRTSRIRWVLHEIRGYRCGENVHTEVVCRSLRIRLICFRGEIFSFGFYSSKNVFFTSWFTSCRFDPISQYGRFCGLCPSSEILNN